VIPQQDAVTFEVIDCASAAGEGQSLQLSRRHRDFRPDRYWSHVELRVFVRRSLLPDHGVKVGEQFAVVLGGQVTAARPAPEPGYAAKLSPAQIAPQLLPPRVEDDGFYAGLIQRDEPPDGGEIVLHLGSGLTCYPHLDAELLRSLDPLLDGEFWEMRFARHEALLFQRA
jgi:hypothetical protein